MNIYSVLKNMLIGAAYTGDIPINGVQFHSGKVKQGDLFVAIPGTQVDGHQYLQDAIHSGASALIGEQPLHHFEVPYYEVSNARLALAQIADHFYHHPSRRHIMVGITGTNGKTTTAHMLYHIMESAGISCSLIGTVCQRINGQEFRSVQTTPDTLQLQKWLDLSRDQVVIMEVSSHGIDQVGAMEFDYTVFTNLTHDHLDYHHTLEQYFATKARLFKQMKKNGEAIISSHCRWGQKLREQLLTDSKPVFTFGSSQADAARITQVKNESPLRFDVYGDRQSTYTVEMTISGMYNALNAAAAWQTARRMGVDADTIVKALRTFPGVPGRFEVYHHPAGAECIIDYAHTPDGLHQFLKTVRAHTSRRLIHIFGFRGNGDRSKRKPILDISSNLSDLTILTLDDLKGADEDQLWNELRSMADLQTKEGILVIRDRTKAIEFAWNQAQLGDRITITGKGNETYESEFMLPCTSDRETIEYLLQNSWGVYKS